MGPEATRTDSVAEVGGAEVLIVPDGEDEGGGWRKSSEKSSKTSDRKDVNQIVKIEGRLIVMSRWVYVAGI
jgi:hypothetical protein